MPSFSDYLTRRSGGFVIAVSGTWVQLTNNASGTAYVSSSASDANGLYSFANVPAGVYTFATGSAAAGPFTPSDDSAYVVYDLTRTFNVKDFGALGNGVADDSTSIQACFDAANTAGGGRVLFPPGTYMGSGLNFYGKIWYQGSGNENTILKLRNGANTFLAQTLNFSALAAGGGGAGPGTSTGGETLFKWSDITIDGNKANNGTAAVPTMRIYGYGFRMTDPVFRNSNHEGLYSEWSTSLPSPGFDSMMSFMEGVKAHDNGRVGVHWNGPHDSEWVLGEVFNNNTSSQAGTAGANIFIDTKGSGLLINGVHSWGLTPTYAFYLGGTGVILCNIVAEGATTMQVALDANDCSIVGGFIYGAGAATPKGVEFGTTGVRQDLVVSGTKINNCTSGALNFTNDGGALVAADVFQSGGTLTTGTINVLTRLDLRTNGVAGGFNQFPAEVHIKSGSALRLYQPNNAGFASLTFDGTQVINTWPYQGAAGQFVQAGAGIKPGTAAGALQAGNLFMGSGVPSNANGNNGDFYFRTDTPGTANQRLYIKSAGAWVALTL